MYESFAKLPLPVRLVYLAVAMLVWSVTLGGMLRRCVVVLCYHNVRPDQAKRFVRQVAAARGRVVPLDAVASRPSERRPRVALSFDDAYANLLVTVAPLMQRESAHWSVFPVSHVLGVSPTWTMPPGHPDANERTMTAEELSGLSKDPLVEIGAHTRTHPSLTTLEPSSLDAEIGGSRDDLRSMLGRAPVSIALPHGSCNKPVAEACRAAGYTRVLTLEHELEPRFRADGLIARFSASPDNWPLEHRLMIDGAYSWLGSFRAILRRARGRIA